MSETWVWDDTINIGYSSITFGSIDFVCDNVEYSKIDIGGMELPATIIGLFYDSTRVYKVDPDAWIRNEYKTITFATPPTGDLLTYLQANATKQATPTIGLKNLSSYNQDLSVPRKKDLDALATTIATKQDKITGGATTITSSNLTANRALISNGSGKVAVSPVTSTELGYLDGVTSNVQTQLNSIKISVTNIESDLSAAIDKYYYTGGTLADGNIDVADPSSLMNSLELVKDDIVSSIQYSTESVPYLVCQSGPSDVEVVLRLTDIEDISNHPLYIFTAYYLDAGYYYHGIVQVDQNGIAQFSERKEVVGSVNGQYGDVEITPASIGAVPTTRTVNNKALSSNITLTTSDVDAMAAKNGTGTGVTSLEHLTVKEVEIDSNTAEGGALYGNSIINIKASVAEAGTPSFTLHTSGPNNTANEMNMYSDHTTIELSDDSGTRGLIIHAPDSLSGLDEDGVIVDGLACFTPEAAETTYRSAPLTGMFYTDVIKPKTLPTVTTTNNSDMLMVVNGSWQTDHGETGIQNAASLIVNKWPDNVTMIVKSFRRWGKLCLFTVQINVGTQISTNYGFTLLEMPYTSIDRVWINNQTQFYMDPNNVAVRVNNDNLATGGYTLTGFYLTTDNARVVS